jgi:hypothetical protein
MPFALKLFALSKQRKESAALKQLLLPSQRLWLSTQLVTGEDFIGMKYFHI